MKAQRNLSRSHPVRSNRRTRRWGVVLVLSALPLAGLWSCSVGIGVTTGGEQDIASARKTIDDGGIPDPAAITVEGFLSEHSIPFDEPEDPGLVYATAGLSWNADLDVFTPVATVVIGFGTTVDEETIQRPPLSLGVVIDASGSMNETIDVRTDTSKLEAVTIAIDRLLANLDDGDRVSLIAFSDRPDVLVENVPGDDIVAIKSALDELVAGGSTDLERGLRESYRTVLDHHDDDRSDRLIVFTDALLTRAYRQTDEVLDVMADYASLDIGTTLFGVGSDFGHETAHEIAQIRGGNYFFLSDYERIVSVFDDEFDFLVTPVAYDVVLQTSVPFEFDVVSVHGIPEEEPYPHVLDLEVPTLFLSNRQGGGAVFVRVRAGALVDFDEENTVAEITLSYTTPDGEQVTQPTIAAVLPGGFDGANTINYFENDGVKRAVLLLNTALAMQASCEDSTWICDDVDPWDCQPPDLDRAESRLTELLVYFDDLAENLSDKETETSRGLSEERALIAQLLANVIR